MIEGYRSRGRLVGLVLVPAPTVPPPDAVLELWATVLARGHIDPDSGLFEPDDEATWERNRRELAKRRSRPASSRSPARSRPTRCSGCGGRTRETET